MATAIIRSDATSAMISVDGVDRFKLTGAAVADLNSETLPTFCTASSSTLNTPISGQWFSVVCGVGVQTATQLWNTSALTFTRVRNIDNINWEAWREVASEYARPTTNFNTIKGNGIFTGLDTSVGSPQAATLGWYIYQRDVSGLWLNQRAVAVAAESVSFVRSSVDGGTTWNAWEWAGAGVGVNQSWTDVTSSRTSGTVYTNSTGKPIQVVVSGATVGTTGSLSANVQAVTVYTASWSLTTGNYLIGTSFIVPAGHQYNVLWSSTAISSWRELR
jgi:hypothetical protein